MRPERSENRFSRVPSKVGRSRRIFRKGQAQSFLRNSRAQLKLFNALPGEEFFARQAEVERLVRTGLDVARSLQPSCFLSGSRKSGKSEVLKQVYNRLFWEQEAVVPFFHALPQASASAEAFCREYFLQSILQCIGFLRRDAQLVLSDEHDLDHIVQLAYESKLSWLISAVDRCHLFLKSHDLQALSRLAILFPATVAARTGLAAFVLIDDFHHLESFAPGSERSLLTGGFLMALESRQAPHCLTGAAKRVFQDLFHAELPGCVEAVPLPAWEPEQAQSLIEGLCRRFDVPCDPALMDFVVRHLDGNPFYIRSVIQAARRSVSPLLTARQFAELYGSELMQGNLQLYFNGLLHSAPLSVAERIKAVEVLHFCAHAPLESSAIKYLRGRSAAEGTDSEKILNALSALELIDYSFGVVSSTQDSVLRDWVVWNFRHKIEGADLALVRYELAAGVLKQCERVQSLPLQAKTIQTLKTVMAAMNCQVVPQSALVFPQLPAPKATPAGGDEIVLPEMLTVTLRPDVSTVEGGFAGPLLVGRGFERGIHADETETVWLAAFSPGSGITGLDEIQRFHQKCERLRSEEGMKNTRFWLVAETRFNQAGLSFAETHRILTSNLEQLRMLAKQLAPQTGEAAEPVEAAGVQNYEMTIPLTADAELVAVRALEQIADSCEFDEKSKGQVRMALLEACVNVKESMEEGQGRIHLAFKTSLNRLTVHLRILPASAFTGDPAKTWGIKMLRALMDDVHVQHGPAGFELVMEKSPRPAVNAKSGTI